MSHPATKDPGQDSVAGGHFSRENLPVSGPPHNHGRTIAGWTLFWAGVVVSLVIAAAIVTDETLLLWIGIGLAVVGCAASAVLRALGYGQPRGGAR